MLQDTEGLVKMKAQQLNNKDGGRLKDTGTLRTQQCPCREKVEILYVKSHTFLDSDYL